MKLFAHLAAGLMAATTVAPATAQAQTQYRDHYRSHHHSQHWRHHDAGIIAITRRLPAILAPPPSRPALSSHLVLTA